MNNRKILYAVAGLIVILLIAWTLSSGNSLGYVEKVTGVSIPDNAQNVSIYDGEAAFLTAHFSIPAGGIEQFATENGFKADRLTTNLMGVDKLDPQYRSLTKAANNVVQGKNDKNRWIFLLDRTTGDVWTTVYR